jgi:hypothetical protein
MTAVATRSPNAPARHRVRTLAARVWAVVLLAMFVAPFVPLLFTAWASELDEGSHLIHDLAHASHTVLMLAPALLAVLLGRGRITAVQTLLAAFLVPLPVAVLGGLMSPADAVVPAVAIVILGILHPQRDRLLRDARPDPVLLGAVAALAIPLVLVAADQLHLQAVLPATEPHAALGHWAGMAFWSAALVCLAVLTALRTPAWRIPLYSGFGAVALVAVGSILNPAMPSSFGAGGGLALLGGAAIFAGLAEVRAGRTEPTNP